MMEYLEDLTDELYSNGDADMQEILRENNGELDSDAALSLIPSLPIIPIPWLLKASGLYEWKYSLPFIPVSEPVRAPSRGANGFNGEVEEQAAAGGVSEFLTPFWFQREELRLDIDGRYPLMKVSGTLYGGLTMRIHWIANLTETGSNTYAGHIWYKDGNASWLPQTFVTLKVTKTFFSSQRKVTITFSGGGAAKRVRTYKWKSSYYHPVDFEYDTVQGTTAVTQINTGAHSNKPVGLPTENLSIEKVFRRAGFNVTTSPAGKVPISEAGLNARWSDMEMHDAMQVYWSHWANAPQWKMWVFFAGLHDRGTNLGGIMFDDIGANHRQGTAIFNNSFISNAPNGDAHPAAWVERMKFWTACHEMGHAFNLAHSWQKALGTPWIPVSNEPEARSFMNYPFRVSGGENTFFGDFEYRFSNGELLFMRHAPERFVQMGNADWFDHHGFQQANVSPTSPYALELRVHRSISHFEFMEPVVVELKLKNVSTQPLIVDKDLLKETDDMTVIVKRQGQVARQWQPFAQYCYNSDKMVLKSGKSLYGSLNIATGIGGWHIAEPGIYTLQVALHLEDEDVVSNELRVRVAPPRNYDEEFVAQDFFSEDVGRVLTFNGSRHLEKANDVLRQVTEQFSERRVALSAQLALGNPLTKKYKLLDFVESGAAAADGSESDKRLRVMKAYPDEARTTLSEALLKKPAAAADTLGHIEYKQMVEQYCDFLADEGDAEAAASGLETAKETLAKRKVLKSVLKDMEVQRKKYIR